MSSNDIEGLMQERHNSITKHWSYVFLEQTHQYEIQVHVCFNQNCSVIRNSTSHLPIELPMTKKIPAGQIFQAALTKFTK